MNKTLQKVMCVFSAGLIFCSSVRADFSASVGLQLIPQIERPSFLQVEIPSELASVEETFEAPAKENPQLILNIQNIHGNYESQVQISKLLGYLYEKYGFKLVFAEGAADKLNPDFIRFFPDAERNKKVADLMARNGELTGIEYYLIDGPADVEAVGIEEASLYRQNYEAFKEVYKKKGEIDAFLELYESRLENLGTRIFSANTRRLLAEWKKFEAGHRDFLPYVKKLNAEAKSVLNLDLESLFAQVEWPQITRLIALQAIEKDLDPKAAEKDKERLISFLKEQKVAPEIIKAVETLDEKKITMSSSETQRRKEDLPRYLFERLVDVAGPKGFRFHDYPAFSLWAGHLILQNEIDSKVLFEEIEKVFTKILNELAVTEKEKDLLELWRDEILIRKLMHLEVVRKEWDRAVYRKDWLALPSMVSRLKKISADDGAGVQMESEDWKELEKMAGDTKEPSAPTPVQAALNTSYDFYDFARQRESVFFDVIKKTMAEKQTNKAVLVTGGFHTDGLMEIFRENDINASVLMPRITGEIDHSGYISTMLENKPSILEFKTQTIEIIASALGGAVQKAQGRSSEAVVSQILPWIIQVEGVAYTIESIKSNVALIIEKQKLPVKLLTVTPDEGGRFLLTFEHLKSTSPENPVGNKRSQANSPQRIQLKVPENVSPRMSVVQRDGKIYITLSDGASVVLVSDGIFVNRVYYQSLYAASSALSRLALNRTDELRRLVSEAQALNVENPEMKPMLSGVIEKLLSQSKSRIVIPGNERREPLQRLSAPDLLLGSDIRLTVLSAGRNPFINDRDLQVAALTGGIVTDPDQLRRLASQLGDLRRPQMDGSNLQGLEGTLLAPSTEKMRMMVVLDLEALSAQDLKQINDYIAGVLISFKNTTAKVVIIDSDLKGSKAVSENVEFAVKIAGLIHGRLSVERIHSLKQLEKIRTLFMHTRDKVLEFHFTRNEDAVSNLLIDPNRSYALVLGRSEARIVEKIKQGLTVGFATLADRLKEEPGLFVRRIGSGVTFVSSLVLSGLKSVLDAVLAIQKIQTSA